MKPNVSQMNEWKPQIFFQSLDKESLVMVKAFRNLLEQMLALDPQKRITVGDALKHAFMMTSA